MRTGVTGTSAEPTSREPKRPRTGSSTPRTTAAVPACSHKTGKVRRHHTYSPLFRNCNPQAPVQAPANPAVYSYAAPLGEHPHLPPTGSSRIVAALASSSVGTPHGPVTLDGEAGRGSWRRASGSSGRDALMPPRLEDGLWDGRVPGDRGRSGGQAPARAHPAAGAPAGGGWGPGTWERLPGATEPRPPSR